MLLIILLIVVLALILISLYSEVRINKLVDDELNDIELELSGIQDTADNLANENTRLKARVQALELTVDKLKESLDKEE